MEYVNLLPGFWLMIKSKEQLVKNCFYQNLNRRDELLCQYLQPATNTDWIFDTLEIALVCGMNLRSAVKSQVKGERFSIWQELSTHDYQSLAVAFTTALEDVLRIRLDANLESSWIRFFTAKA